MIAKLAETCMLMPEYLLFFFANLTELFKTCPNMFWVVCACSNCSVLLITLVVVDQCVENNTIRNNCTELIQKERQNRTCINLRTNGEIVKDQNKVANMLVKYFSTMADEIGGRDVNSLKEDDLSNHQSLTNILNANKKMHGNFRFKPLRSKQVQTVLEKLNVRQASDYDSITPKMLKLASSGIADSFTKLHNESIQKGEWLEAWKKGECSQKG